MEINEIEMQASSTSILTPPLARRNRADRGSCGGECAWLAWVDEAGLRNPGGPRVFVQVSRNRVASRDSIRA